MVSFGDGPAAGAVLELIRAPLFLRVVIDPHGEIDALDRLDDAPAEDEAIHVYHLAKEHGMAHVLGHDKRGRRWGRWVMIAEYIYHVEQPADDIVRDQAKWREWVSARPGQPEHA